MRRKTLFLIVTIIFLLFVIVGLFINQVRQKETPSIKESALVKEAPDFSLPDIYGNAFRLSALQGKVILIDFWATWCPFCRESIPVLKSLYDDYKDKGFEVVGIALEYDNGRALRIFSEEKKINYTLLIGNEELAKDYSAYGVPTRFLINREGKIVKEFVGFQDKETFAAAIQELL